MTKLIATSRAHAHGLIELLHIDCVVVQIISSLKPLARLLQIVATNSAEYRLNMNGICLMILVAFSVNTYPPCAHSAPTYVAHNQPKYEELSNDLVADYPVRKFETEEGKVMKDLVEHVLSNAATRTGQREYHSKL